MKFSFLGSLVLAAGIVGFGVSEGTAQTLTEVIVPQYMASGTSSRLPVAYRLTLSGLTPSATYRYIQQMVNPTEAAEPGPTFTSGAGNPMFVDAGAGTFTYTTSTGFVTAGQYGEFVTDGSGSYTGWFVVVNTGNARFDGTVDVFLRLRLNDGAGGTTAATTLTATSGTRPLVFGATAGLGTGVVSAGTPTVSPLTAKNFVALYDNAAGSGRPLYCVQVEDDANGGAALASTVAYYTGIQATATAWAGIIPNTLPTGLQRIEERGLTTGAIVAAYADADGVWPSTVNTVNPAGGTTALVITNPADYTPAAVSDWVLMK